MSLGNKDWRQLRFGVYVTMVRNEVSVLSSREIGDVGDNMSLLETLGNALSQHYWKWRTRGRYQRMHCREPRRALPGQVVTDPLQPSLSARLSSFNPRH